MRNFTFNLGIRFDYHNAYVPEQATAAGAVRRVKALRRAENTRTGRTFRRVLGVAWDMRGNGKTVARFNYGHYWPANRSPPPPRTTR